MEPTTAFNTVAVEAPVEATGQSDVAEGGGSHGPNSPSTAHEATAQTDNIPQAKPEDAAPTQETTEAEHVDPQIQAINDAQDRRLAEEARVSDLNMQARWRVEEDLDRRYGGNIRQLRSEIDQLQNTLDNSGPVRLGWLKLTRQISQDPKRDLNTLQSTLQMNEQYQAEGRQAFESRLSDEAKARDIQRKAPQATASMSDARRPTVSNFTKEQAAERLAFLEATRARPTNDNHLRPGGKTEEFSHVNAAAQHELETSKLRVYLRGHETPQVRAELAQEQDTGHDLSL